MHNAQFKKTLKCLSNCALCIVHYAFLSSLLFVNSAQSQSLTASPYSRYGVGDLQFNGLARNQGMSGLGIAVTGPFTINYSNAASYSNLTLTTFEVAATANFFELKNQLSTGYRNNLSFGYFVMGLPLKQKKAGLSFGLLPYSNVGYKIEDLQKNAAGASEFHKYEGSGGLNQFYLGTGWAPVKNFSIGVNAAFLFGSLNHTRRIEYTDLSYYNSKLLSTSTINDFYYNFGLLKTFDSLKFAKSDSIIMFDRAIESLDDSVDVLAKVLTALAVVSDQDSATVGSQRMKLSESIAALRSEMMRLEDQKKSVLQKKQRSDWSLNIGLTGSPSVSLKGKHSVFAGTYTLAGGPGEEVEVFRDTVLDTEDKSGKLVLPVSLGFGFTFRKSNQWLMGADFSMQDWSKYSLFGENDFLQNSWRTSVGMQWVPDERGINTYFSTMQYRLGVHYEQTFLELHDTRLNDYGASIGIGFPARRGAAIFQFSLEAGRRGTVDNNLVALNYFKCILAFTLSDRWFIPTRIE